MPPARSRGGAGDCALPWQDAQVGVPPAGTWKEWQPWQETPALPPARSSPWQCWQLAKFHPASRTRLLWNSASCGLRIPPSWMPERKNESFPSTTQARMVG